MIDTEDLELEEFLDYATNTKKPDVYCIYDIATGYSNTGSKSAIQFCLDSLMEYQHEYGYTLLISSKELRNKNDEIVVALVENLIYEDLSFD